MKKLIFILIVLMIKSLTTTYGQIVESSCEAPDSIVEKYQDDADVLTLRKFYDNDMPWADSIEIPDAHADTILNALLAVWNAEGLAARDTVVELFDIHSRELYAVNYILIGADSSLSWMQLLESGNIPCGKEQVDSLINRYNLYIADYYNGISDALAWPIFKGEENLNMGPLGRQFLLINDVQYVDTIVNNVGDGNRIDCSINSGFVKLTYSYGWGDCLNGCMYRRFWEFRVYYDCSVEYLGSYGNVLEDMGISEKNDGFPIEIYPNPCRYNVNIHGLNKQDMPIVYSLYNSNGMKILSGKTKNGSIDLSSPIDAGLYILEIYTKEKTIRKKIQIIKN